MFERDWRIRDSVTALKVGCLMIRAGFSPPRLDKLTLELLVPEPDPFPEMAAVVLFCKESGESSLLMILIKLPDLFRVRLSPTLIIGFFSTSFFFRFLGEAGASSLFFFRYSANSNSTSRPTAMPALSKSVTTTPN